MADDISLLLKVKGDASGAQKAAADTRTAISQLRSQITSDSKAIATAGQAGAKGTQSLATSLQTVQTSLQAIGGPVGGLAGQITNATSLLSGFSGEAAAMAGPVGIAVAAIAALTAATIGLGKQFFDLTVATAEWQGKLYDLSQQTGVNVETLSALEILAKTTGGSIESITASLGIFQKHLEASLDPTSKEAKLLKELGVESKNTEDALRQTLTALAAMPEGFTQTSRALELFGRGGKQILAILKEMDGDLDGAIEKFREMGILIDEDTAKAADEFNDQMAMVQFQLRATTALLVRDVTPHILSALQSISKFIQDNQSAIEDWGRVVGNVFRGVSVIAQSEFTKMITVIANFITKWLTLQGLIAQGLQWMGSGSGPTGPTPGDIGIGAGILRQRAPGFRGGGGGGGGAPKVSEGQQLLNKLTEEYNRLQEKANNLSKVQVIGLELLDKKYQGLNATLRDQILTQAALIDREKEKAELDKRKEQATEKIRALLESQIEAIKDARIGEEQWTDQIKKLEAELKKLGLTMDDNTKKLLLDNAATQKALALTRERIVLEQTRIDMMERERLATPERKQEQLEREQGIIRSEGDETRERQVNPPDVSIWDEVLGSIEDRMITFHDASQMYVVGAFHGMADAAQDAIQAWILYGGSLGKALKQALAAELAAVSARAMVQAALHAAYAIGSLAMGNFAAAGQHAIAAAKFAAVAALTGLSARAIAGNSFQQAATNSGVVSRGGSSGASGSSRSNQPGVTDVNRNALPQPTGTLTINLGLKPGIVADEFRKDYLLNGPTRLIIKSDGQG